MTEDQIQQSVARHRQRNNELQQVLSLKGIKVTDQRPIDVHFWTWSQRDAAVLARELFKQGFLLKLLSPSPTPDDEGRWGIEAGALAIPERILGDEFSEKMVRLAAQYDAIYDGWGTET